MRFAKSPIAGHGRTGRFVGLLLLGAAAFALLPPLASAVRQPTFNSEAEYRYERAECVEGSTGYRAIGFGKATVKLIPYEDYGKNFRSYYLKVKTQIDTKTSIGWRQIQGASRTVTTARFGRGSMPYWIRSGVNTGLPTAGEMSAKVTVWLKRDRDNFRDKTYWKFSFRSRSFECVDPSDFT